MHDPVLDSLSSAEIIGLTIIGEARGEPIEGQVAVGCVIRNRLSPTNNSYLDVCLKPFQFSCWNENDPNYSFLIDLANQLFNGQFLSDAYIIQCMYVAKGIEDLSIMDNTDGAVNYMTVKLFNSDKKPKWADNSKNERVYGNQIFFNA